MTASSSFRRDLSIVATMADLPQIADFIEDACCQAEVDPRARFDLLMAADEACTNVFEHAYGGSPGKLDLRFETRGHDVILTLRDHGRTFDPESVPTPDAGQPLDERPIGGLGLHLMRSLVDRVSFAFSPRWGNTLVMEKHAVVSDRPSSVSPSASRPSHTP